MYATELDAFLSVFPTITEFNFNDRARRMESERKTNPREVLKRLQSSGWACEICEVKFLSFSDFHVDHVEIVGLHEQLRSVLCKVCNGSILGKYV